MDNSIRADYEKRGYQFYSPEIFDDAMEKDRKKILVLTHQLSLTGAPLALFLMVRILSEEAEVVVLTVEDGPLKEDYKKLGVSVVNTGKYWERRVIFQSFARKFDAVIANTVLHFPAVLLLNGSNIPVFWWIHEHENYFSYGRGEIPDPSTLKDNVHVLAAGEYVAEVLYQEFSYRAQIFHVGFDDCAEETCAEQKRNGLHFLCVGTYGAEKGQDILAEAYDALPVSYKEKLSLTFIGNDRSYEQEIYDIVKTLSEKEPQVTMQPLLPRNEVLACYAQADGLILCSRREVLSMAALEHMMLSKCVIASSTTGNAWLIRHKENGFVFESGDAQALKECLRYVVDHREQLGAIGIKAREVYEKEFTMEQFRRRIKEEIFHFIR